jgi:hypothetical protein
MFHDINSSLTRREKIFLISMGVLMLILSFIPQSTVNNYEVLLLVVILIPLGLMIATDPERRK